jgi:hypothetical protein
VTWRVRLRKIVNREEHLGPVRRGLLRIIDPIELYMRKSEEETRPHLHQRWKGAPEGWTAYERLEPEPSAAGAEVTVIDATPRTSQPMKASTSTREGTIPCGRSTRRTSRRRRRTSLRAGTKGY